MKVVKHAKEKSGMLAPCSRGLTPFWPMRRLQRQIDRLFEEPFGDWLTPDGPFMEGWLPAVAVSEDKTNVFIKGEIPGMKREEFKVFVTGENLHIAGERKVESEEEGREMYRSERYLGRFHRSIPLPTAVDSNNIEAHYKDGILTITCPKTEEAKRKPIAVKVD